MEHHKFLGVDSFALIGRRNPFFARKIETLNTDWNNESKQGASLPREEKELARTDLLSAPPVGSMEGGAGVMIRGGRGRRRGGPATRVEA